MNLTKAHSLISPALSLWFAALSLNGADGTTVASASRRPELEYLKAVNQAAPPQDPQLLFLLMAQYANANLQADGVEFFLGRLREFGPRLNDPQKALYLSAIGLLRAQHATAVPLLRRITYVKETIAILEQAEQLSGGKVFVVNWIAGVVYAQLPNRFHRAEAAEKELAWCLANIKAAPNAGWLREVYYQLGRLELARGEKVKAQEYLRQSGYADFNKPITLTTPFVEDTVSGHAFSQRQIAEIVPKRVYAVSGFDFSEYYFVVSGDGKQLIGIDAGTRPDFAKAAYEALRAYEPGLPELTTIFITHSHWDHIGGHAYFRSLNSKLRIYARNNYEDEIARELSAPAAFDKEFFGNRFNVEDVRSFMADATVDRATELNVGETRIELIPVQGGETHDALFIYLPEQSVMFVGDFIMPYIGAPFVNEGDLQGLLDAIDVLAKVHPQHLLHGHEALTRNFASVSMLADLKTDLMWLRDQVLSAIRRGEENAVIQQANLIPPDLLTKHTKAQIPYLIMREHVIDRLYSQTVGYWQANMQGVYHISRAEQAELLADYLHVSQAQFVKALQRLADDGKYELAASLLDSSGGRFTRDETVAGIRRLIYLKLMEQYQNGDPFKFILYSSKAGQSVPGITPGK